MVDEEKPKVEPDAEKPKAKKPKADVDEKNSSDVVEKTSADVGEKKSPVAAAKPKADADAKPKADAVAKKSPDVAEKPKADAVAKKLQEVIENPTVAAETSSTEFDELGHSTLPEGNRFPKTTHALTGKLQAITSAMEDEETASGYAPLQPSSHAPVFDTQVHVFAYGIDDFIEGPLNDIEKLPDIICEWPVTWVHVVGFKNVELLERLGIILKLHHLALEDVVNVDQRPKIEDYGRTLFVVVRMIETLENRIESEQLSMFLLENCVITFDSDPGDCIEPVRERIRKGRGHMRDHGPDHLIYAIIDTVIDAYFPLLERFGERLEALETAILADPRRELIVELHNLKRDLLTMRRAIWPMRDVVNSMIRDTYPSISEETRIYLRDCYDHAVRIIDLIESYRQVASDLMDVYLSSVSNRMNEVMKVLTVISTIFIPPTFIAGIYGMNFSTDISPYNMPELNWYFGYPLCLALMFVMTVSVLSYLYVRGMLGGKMQ